jgi:hypothetical protein
VALAVKQEGWDFGICDLAGLTLSATIRQPREDEKAMWPMPIRKPPHVKKIALQTRTSNPAFGGAPKYWSAAHQPSSTSAIKQYLP